MQKIRTGKFSHPKAMGKDVLFRYFDCSDYFLLFCFTFLNFHFEIKMCKFVLLYIFFPSKKPKKRTRHSHSNHTRRRAKRIHSDKWDWKRLQCMICRVQGMPFEVPCKFLLLNRFTCASCVPYEKSMSVNMQVYH